MIRLSRVSGRVDDVDGARRQRSVDLVETSANCSSHSFVGDVADVRRAEDVVHREQQVARVAQRLLLGDVSAAIPGASAPQRGDERSRLD